MDNKVSIILPTYKRAVTVFARALDSLCHQSYDNLEIIIVDDNSKEYGGRKGIYEYALSKHDDRIKYIANETNLGGSLARNKGIDIATGAYISFLDDDDEYLPDKVMHQVEYMKHHDTELTFSDMVMVNEVGKIVDYRNYNDIERFDNEYLFKYHLMHHMTGTPTFMFVTEALRKIGGFDNVKKGQEFYLMLKAIEHGLKIEHVSVSDVIVHKHEDESVSSGENQIKGENQLYSFKKKHINRFSNKEWRFISFRHYAVLGVAFYRSHNLLKAMQNMIIAFFCAPVQSIQQFSGFRGRVRSIQRPGTNSAGGKKI